MPCQAMQSSLHGMRGLYVAAMSAPLRQCCISATQCSLANGHTHKCLVCYRYAEDENKAREAANDAWIFSLASGTWTKVEYTSAEVPRVRAWLLHCCSPIFNASKCFQVMSRLAVRGMRAQLSCTQATGLHLKSSHCMHCWTLHATVTGLSLLLSGQTGIASSSSGTASVAFSRVGPWT